MRAYVVRGVDFSASRFVDDAFGFALTWNYWFNDAISTASDLVALQLVLQYWTTKFPGWGLSLIFWVLLIMANIVTVRVYGEVGVPSHAEGERANKIASWSTGLAC